MADSLTANRDKLDYARVLVEFKVDKKPKHIISLRMQNGAVFSQRVVYEWLPVKCPYCSIWGQA